MLSQTAEHALRALLYLVRQESEEPTSAAHIAQAIGAPYRYLAKTLATLADAGIVRSARGRVGGYALVPAPSAVSVAEVMALFPRGGARTRCLLAESSCNPERPCAAHSPWLRAQDEALQAFQSLSLADLATPKRSTLSHTLNP